MRCLFAHKNNLQSDSFVGIRFGSEQLHQSKIENFLTWYLMLLAVSWTRCNYEGKRGGVFLNLSVIYWRQPSIVWEESSGFH